MFLVNTFWKDIDNYLSNNYLKFFENLPIQKSSFPNVKLFYKKDKFFVQMETPGLEKKDIEISISKNYLNVSGNIQQKTENKTEKLLRKERYYGEFNRNIQLPEEIDTNQTKASLDNGLLTIEFSVNENQKLKKIDIQSK